MSPCTWRPYRGKHDTKLLKVTSNNINNLPAMLLNTVYASWRNLIARFYFEGFARKLKIRGRWRYIELSAVATEDAASVFFPHVFTLNHDSPTERQGSFSEDELPLPSKKHRTREIKNTKQNSIDFAVSPHMAKALATYAIKLTGLLFLHRLPIVFSLKTRKMLSWLAFTASHRGLLPDV